MNKNLLLEELDLLDTYFEEVIETGRAKQDLGLEEAYILMQLRDYVKDAIKFVKGEK